jgi:hypothetical protein
MHKISLNPQIGLVIDGIGQINFGDTKQQVSAAIGAFEDIVGTENRVSYAQYGFFADFNKSNGKFEAVEFWNDGAANVSQVFIYEQEVLRTEAQKILKMLTEKNNAPAIEGWFYNIDVIYSGGNPANVLAIIAQYKTDGTYEESKQFLLQDLEKTTYFASFGIGYKGYCQAGFDQIQAILNG